MADKMRSIVLVLVFHVHVTRDRSPILYYVFYPAYAHDCCRHHSRRWLFHLSGVQSLACLNHCRLRLPVVRSQMLNERWHDGYSSQFD